MNEWKWMPGGRLTAMAVLGAFAFAAQAGAEDLKPVQIPGDRAYPESMSATSDGTIYVSRLCIRWRCARHARIFEGRDVDQAGRIRNTLDVRRPCR